MEYRKQSCNACLAYSLWQIGLVKGEDVRDYEEDSCFDSWEEVENWLSKHLPLLKGKLRESLLTMVPTGDNSLKGKGIVHLYAGIDNTTHAISYEDGIVLDPSQPEERLTLEEYLKRDPKWKVAEVFQLGEEEN